MTSPSWKPLIAAYLKPNVARASWQLIDSVGSYVLVWCAMAWTVTVSWWLTIPLVVLAGLLLVRVFIILHDCGHGSFFASRTANIFWGRVAGVLTFTPYEHWRGRHAIHHGSTGNLDRRGIGDVWTMTVREYQESSLGKRLGYRFMRNPIVLLGILPLAMFLVDHRIPAADATPRERRSVWFTTALIIVLGVALSLIFGFLTYLFLQLVVLGLAGSVGVWLFYTQHQFEAAYWKNSEDWSYEEAALEGSSFLKLPRVIQWFTGNIGYHHIHHLDSRIPNYNLQACHESHPMFEQVAPLTLLHSLGTFRLKLWD